MKFQQTMLANGLTVIGEQRDSAVSAALGFFVRTGARDESPELWGVSHFLEHMMFKGTARRSALDITYALSAIGAQSNAFTSEETTVYYAAVLPEYLDEVFDILADMLRPSLDADEFATEKKVILEEIALYKDRPSHILFETALKEFFGTNPAGNPVLGTTESVGALTAEQMRGYFDRRYTAANTVLAVAGKFDWEHVVALAERMCGSWPAGKVERAYAEGEQRSVRTNLYKKDLQCAHVCLMTPGPSATDNERHALQVLTCILGDSDGSRTYWELIDKGLAETASIDADEMDRTGFVYAYASADPANIVRVEAVLREILETPQRFTADELARAVTKLRTRLVLQGESSMRRLMAIGNDWLYRQEYSTLEDELTRLKAVSRERIEQALERFSLTPLTTLTLHPEV